MLVVSYVVILQLMIVIICRVCVCVCVCDSCSSDDDMTQIGMSIHADSSKVRFSSKTKHAGNRHIHIHKAVKSVLNKTTAAASTDVR